MNSETNSQAPMQTDAQTHQFDSNGLYILVTDQGGSFGTIYHWGLYLHKSGNDGETFHISNSEGPWLYHAKSTTRVVSSKSLLAGLKVSTIRPETHEALRRRLAVVPLEDTGFGELSCITWVLDALLELDEEKGIIIQKDRVRYMELEAREWAQKATKDKKCVIFKSKYYRG
ncbi:hypothetical protein GLAREA_02188 [Glarea lozoyensis ATCC 20868]|uniref:Uncharacterized protein n=1 Tax=Glarea lozoyensis (strain ATCC 20868 / MF5171) TaxID=1116229 RepID=S3D2N3_GLAL2|nr:uncharacterized protein GLAREA_02188 [Glarea lozoyensis ATCC 20868]EPE26276.1 hypothetical protein GLAREA_02188 [Glarea lozoyensis ATCC 20868]